MQTERKEARGRSQIQKKPRDRREEQRRREEDAMAQKDQAERAEAAQRRAQELDEEIGEEMKKIDAELEKNEEVLREIRR